MTLSQSMITIQWHKTIRPPRLMRMKLSNVMTHNNNVIEANVVSMLKLNMTDRVQYNAIQSGSCTREITKQPLPTQSSCTVLVVLS
mmetsp:Transcript_57130/g.68315  ORF Transcript_57130/g.68315 Transcript_57130/m.68315 type:complete len:86 (+) Transcript_57130:885-1142(+)